MQCAWKKQEYGDLTVSNTLAVPVNRDRYYTASPVGESLLIEIGIAAGAGVYVYDRATLPKMIYGRYGVCACCIIQFLGVVIHCW